MLNDIKYLGFLKTIKYAYQRVVRGYDDRIYWELDGYFDKFVDPIKKFCEEALKETADEKRIEIFSTTIRLIEEYKKMDYVDNYKSNNQTEALWSYVGKNIRWYWD